MVNVYIMHYIPNKMKEIIEVMKTHYSYSNIELSIILSQRYELDYFIRHKTADIVIIDTNLICNEYDGIFLAERIKIINRKTLVVFLSDITNNDLLIRLINTEPFAYINVKNLKADLPPVLDKALSIITKEGGTFTYLKKGEKYSISLGNVIYFVSSHRTIKYICIDGREDFFYDKLDNVEKIATQLSSDFIRISQSYLINKKFVVNSVGNDITMINKQSMIISRKYHDSKYLINSKY